MAAGRQEADRASGGGDADGAGGVVRKHIIYEGRVQGVGFRYTCIEIAREIGGLTGYAKNLADGTVEVEVQGALHDVERFLRTVAAAFGGNIRETRATDLPESAAGDGFVIRH